MVSRFPWPVPPLPTLSALADHLALTPTQLAWFANPDIAHYHCLTQPKPGGGLRLLAAPKPRLKALQRQLLSGILNHLPLHPAAHGFCPGRSVLTFVAPHVAQPTILRLDLADFFPSIAKPRVAALFRTAGYPEPVADSLAALCSHRGTLPQGAPTSPALANAIAYKLDCRLSGLAHALGLQYTRYADDLALSGPKIPTNLADHVAAILLEEGFTPNYRKTRRMQPSQRQHLTGLTLNQKPNLPRPAYDELKAILTNCLRHGPASQNRHAHPAFAQHLQGRILHLATVNPTRAARLQKLYDQVTFS
ncbi:MAG: reverse transcriptase family protein [Acidobacteria bacterium]|nr:reverse transcriptase family protein [Acidobacteriota bacterium]